MKYGFLRKLYGINNILIYLNIEVARPVLQLLGESFCCGIPEPGWEGVLCELSSQFVRNVVLVGNVPTEVCQVMLCELFLLASLLNLDRKRGHNNAVNNQRNNTLAHLEQFFISEAEGHQSLTCIRLNLCQLFFVCLFFLWR